MDWIADEISFLFTTSLGLCIAALALCLRKAKSRFSGWECTCFGVGALEAGVAMIITKAVCEYEANTVMLAAGLICACCLIGVIVTAFAKPNKINRYE